MLHRSFKSAKCKTSLKLAASRIKLLKNKRAAQVKQLKRELAQLLESGQDQTARIRVEHVVREEKTMAAYDLLEIYCELIVARLPIIESQKSCPIDLKEAISSVVFASPRCADVPELMDVRKHFTVKYGKEFVSAAVELRPDCGVSRLLVEKLSAKAPDGPTKIEILSAIAEEHNVEWEPKSFGEKDLKPSEDLLNGPNTFGSASHMFANPSYVQAPPLEDKRTSHLQVPPTRNEKYDVPANFHEHNARPSPSSQTESMPSGSGTERTGFRHSYTGDENALYMGRHNWNMEFKDATAAAQAAAESAERASMAARAAAELSSRVNTTRQYSAESRRDEEELHRYTDSTLQSEHYAKGPINIALHGRDSRMDYEQINGSQQDDLVGIGEKLHGNSFKSTDKPSQLGSLKSNASSVHGDSLVNNLSVADRYSRNSSSELGQGYHFGQAIFKKQSSRSEADYMNKLQEGLNPMNVGGFEEVTIRKQTSHASSHSRSSTFSDDHHVVSNFNHHSLGGDADENPFAVNNMGTTRRNSNKSSSPENAVFDDYGSDQDEYKIDLERKNKEHEYLDFSSHSRNSSAHMFANTNTWNERQNIDESKGTSTSQNHLSKVSHSHPVFSESLPNSITPSHPDDTLPVNFDDSDASISESEEELDKSKLVMNKDTNRSNVYSRTSEVIQGDGHGFSDSSFVDKGNDGSSKPWLQSSSFNKKPVEVHSDIDQGTRVDTRSARNFGYGNETTSHSSPRFTASTLNFDDTDSNNQQVDEDKHQKSQQPSRFSMGQEVRGNVHAPPTVEGMESAETLKESSWESGKELNFAILSGGLRNKGYKRPQYIVSPSRNASSSKQRAEYTFAKSEEWPSATVKISNRTGTSSQDPLNREVRTELDGRPSTRAHFGSHDDDSFDNLPQQTSTGSQERYSKKVGIEANKTSSARTQVKYIDSPDSDSEEDFHPEELMSKPRLNLGLSRRTKATPSKSEKSYSKTTTTVLSEASSNSGHNEERNHPTRIKYSTESRQKPLYENKSSGLLGNSEKPRLVEEAVNMQIPESKGSFWGESVKPSGNEKASNTLPNIVTLGSSRTESLKTSSGETQTPSKAKASHVHPKLPDYDAITAHLQSLRKNHY